MSWSMNFSLKGKIAGGQPPKLKSGTYKGKITKAEQRESNRIMFVIEVIEDPEEAGNTAVTSLAIPKTAEDKVLMYWRGLAESCGYSREEIEERSGWTQEDFKDKVCMFKYEAKSKTQEYAKVTWLSEYSYRRLKTREEISKA